MTRKATALVVALLVVGWYSPLGKSLNCTITLRESLIFEMPEITDDETVEDYRVKIREATQGCADLAVRDGPDSPGARVVCCEGVRYEVNTHSRLVYVSTAEP